MNTKANFKTWLILAEVSKDTEALKLEKLTRPRKVGKVATPETLDDMTIGQMVQLSDCGTGGDMFYRVCKVLLGLEPKQVDRCRAVEVVRFVGWVYGQVSAINKLFDKAKRKPTAEEVRAGINQLTFGIFGMIDWYALRMGITDHEEVMSVPWVRVYKCLDMDNQKNEFERRLSKEYSHEH